MERVWKEENAMINIKTDFDVIEILLSWLEKEDSEIEINEIGCKLTSRIICGVFLLKINWISD